MSKRFVLNSFLRHFQISITGSKTMYNSVMDFNYQKWSIKVF